MKKRRLRDRHKASDIVKYRLRPFRMKIKKHKSKSKKSFYAKCWWELHYRDSRKETIWMKRQRKRERAFEAKMHKDRKKIAYICWNRWSFHNGDNGCSYFLRTKAGKPITDKTFKVYEEAELFAHILGYDIVMQSHMNTIMIE